MTNTDRLRAVVYAAQSIARAVKIGEMFGLITLRLLTKRDSKVKLIVCD